MAKSRGRKFAELVAPTNGVFDAASIPTIALSKLASSTFSVNSESASLGGNVELDSNDITEHSSALYFTNTRADTRADSRIAAHNLLARAGGTMTGNLTLGDNVNAYFGASSDLRIYHDGTNSHIINSTGELRFTGSSFAFKSDSVKLYFGASDDLQIYHDGSNSYISDAGTGDLIITGTVLRPRTDQFTLNNAANSEHMIQAVADGAVTLYYDGVAKLATTSSGVQTTGTLNVNGAYSFPTSDGTSGQVLQTDGSGNLTFATGGGAGDITAVVAGTNLTGGATSGSATVNLATNLSGLGTISSGPITVTTGANQALLVTGGPSSLHQKIYNTSTTSTYSYLQLTTVNSSSTQNSGYIIKNAAQNAGNSLGNNSLYLWNQTNEVELVPAGTIGKRITVDTSGDLTVRGAGAAVSTGIVGEAYSGYFGLRQTSQSKGSEYMILSANDHTYISASSGYNVILRHGGNDSTNQLVIGNSSTGLSWRGNTIWTAENDGASSGLFSQYTNTLVGTGGINNAVSNNHVEYSGQISASVTGLFNASNNANGILRLNTHPGNYYHDLGFSSDGNMYHRNFTNSNAFTTAAWYKMWDASNDGSGSGLDADTLDGVQLSNIARTDLHETFTSNITVNGNIYTGDGNDGYFYNDSNGRTAFAGGDFYIQNSVGNYYNYATNQYIGDSSGDNIYFRANVLSGTGWGINGAGKLTTRDHQLNAGYHLQRSDHHSGHLEGSYNNIGGNSYKTNPIYTIGSSYNPGDAGLSNMYGIGYSHPNASFISFTGASGWGMYVAADGDARVWLDGSAGVISSTGHHYVGSNVVWNAGNDGAGSGLDSDTVDGQHASEMSWGHDNSHGTYSDFNSFVNTALFGCHYVAGSSNSPGHSGATQYYHQRMSLGSNYNNYSLQFAIPRNRSDNYLYYRNEENGSAGSWYKMKAGDSDTLAGLSAKGVGSATGASQVLTSNTNNYFVHHSWIDVGTNGIYSSTTNGAHFYPNTQTSYASWRTAGSRGGYDGILFDSGGDVAVMFDSGGNGGFYRQPSGRWFNYHHVGNNCTGFSTSTTSSSYSVYVNGAIYATGNIVAYSDRRIKENIVPIDNALEKVNKLAGVYYNKIEDEKKTREIGFIAQDVNEVAPELVTYAEDVDQYGVKYGNTTALLVEAVKELTQQVKDLKQELEELKNG